MKSATIYCSVQCDLFYHYFTDLNTIRIILTAQVEYNQSSVLRAFFIFIFFENIFLQKYIFNITIYSFVPLPPGIGAAGGLPPGIGAAGAYM